MSKVVKYICDMCHKEVADPFDLVRLTKQLYGIGRYNQFSYDSKIDLCIDCYEKLEEFIRKEVDQNDSKQISQGSKKETESFDND